MKISAHFLHFEASMPLHLVSPIMLTGTLLIVISDVFLSSSGCDARHFRYRGKKGNPHYILSQPPPPPPPPTLFLSFCECTDFSCGFPLTDTQGLLACMNWFPWREMVRMLRMPSRSLKHKHHDPNAVENQTILRSKTRT